MKFGEPITIEAEVVTPIHIGSGEEIKPLSYVTDKEFVYVIDEDKFFDSLSEREHELFLNWLGPIIDKLDNIAQKISKAKRERNWALRDSLNKERRKVESSMTLEAFLRKKLETEAMSFFHSHKCIAYRVRYALNPRTAGFKFFIKNTNFKPYIPATEIKGAIRNAFVFTAMENNWEKYSDLLSKLRPKISTIRNLRDIKDKRERNKIERRLRSQIAEEYKNIVRTTDKDFLRGKFNDPKYDLFKLIHLTDPPSLPIEKLSIQPIKVLGSNIPQFFLETLMPKIKFQFTMRLPDLSHHTVENSLKELRLWNLQDKLSIESIFSFCYIRSVKILADEEKYFNAFPQIKKVIRELKAKNEKNAPLLRLGAGQGFLGVTTNLQIKNKDEKLFDEVIRKGISFLRKRWRTQPYNFPKTKRVVVDRNGEPSTILGWLKLSKLKRSS